MDKILYYVTLSEHLLTQPGSEGLVKMMKYRQDKDFGDLAKFVKDCRLERERTPGSQEDYLFNMAKKLTEIVEVDTKEPIGDYIDRLNQTTLERK